MMNISQHPKVIILTGPCGVGKTTIANLLIEELSIELVSGDDIKSTLFPDIDYINKHSTELALVKEKIFELSELHFSNNKSVLIDYVVLGKEYIERFKHRFKDHLVIKVLLPKKKIIYDRDQQRESWVSGRRIIDELYSKYESLKDVIGESHYVDNGEESPIETTKELLALLDVQQ